jgi:hypothetical protein
MSAVARFGFGVVLKFATARFGFGRCEASFLTL